MFPVFCPMHFHNFHRLTSQISLRIQKHCLICFLLSNSLRDKGHTEGAVTKMDKRSTKIHEEKNIANTSYLYLSAVITHICLGYSFANNIVHHTHKMNISDYTWLYNIIHMFSNLIYVFRSVHRVPFDEVRFYHHSALFFFMCFFVILQSFAYSCYIMVKTMLQDVICPLHTRIRCYPSPCTFIRCIFQLPQLLPFAVVV